MNLLSNSPLILPQNANEGEAPQTKTSRSKAHNEGEKMVIRRLPPGMTQPEFVTILGSDWEVSNGKVDWLSYIPGKVSAEYVISLKATPLLIFCAASNDVLISSPSKPSRPSRAYLHLMRKDDIMPLSEVVRSSTWEDAKSTFTDPALVGPPVLEFSVYKKIAGTKKRTDARQGTIDQDPEFMAFLEDLANPAPMRESIDVEDPNDTAKVEAKVTTTPLVEYLKEKKANKGKDGASGKISKSGGKGRGGFKDDDTSNKRKGKDSKGDRTDKTPKETVKILTKKAATEQAAEAAKEIASQIATTNASTTATTGAGAGAGASASSDVPKSRRAGIAAAARILQRDLGLSPGSAHRRARHDAAKAEADAKGTVSSTKESDTVAIVAPLAAVTGKSSTASEAAPARSSKGRPESPATTRSQSGRRIRGGKNADKGKGTAATETANASAQPTAVNPPVILKKRNDSEVTTKAPPTITTTTTETPSSSQVPSSNATSNKNNNKQGAREKGNTKQSQKKPSSVSASATRAFVKHVSASQGVNDASLREALEAFGTITLVEIDKRKGFAYVDFSEHDALAKAVTASPISIGQASVQVLERKDKKSVAAAPSTTSSKEGSLANGEKEKPSGGRGRRGRGGGKAGHGADSTAAANKEPAAAAANTGG